MEIARDPAVFNVLYRHVAHWLTAYENHRTEAAHTKALLAKLFWFGLINHFASLMFVAFLKRPWAAAPCFDPERSGGEDDDDGAENCSLELSLQFGTLYLAHDVVGRLARSVAWPWARRKAKAAWRRLQAWAALWCACFSTRRNRRSHPPLGPIEAQFLLLEPYDPAEGLLMGYLQLLVQW